MPTWILLGLASPVISGVANVIAKINVDRYAPGALTYLFWMGAQNVVIGPITMGVGGAVQGFDAIIILGGLMAGSISAVAIIQYVFAFKIGQVARVAPIFSMSPLVVAPLAAAFLDEALSALAMAAILLAVGGGILVSWQRSGPGHFFATPVASLLALSGAAFLGVATVLSKSFLEGDIFWLYLGAYRLGFGLAMAGITVVTREVRTGMRVTLRNSAFLRLIILEEGVLISVAMVVRFAAINLGPVSLVSALNSAQQAMVFIYSLLLAGLFPLAFGNWVTKRTLHTQTVGIAVIVGAVAIISLE